VRDYAAHLYIGTSSWLAAHVPFKKTDILSSLASVPCAIPGRYLSVALQATAGGNLTFLRDKILYHQDELLREERLPDVYKVMDRIAERTPAGSHGVLYTPWIYGERAPAEDSTVRAAIYNLSLENSREDIIRAVLEGVAFNTRWLLRPFEKFLGRSLDGINMVGGGAVSNIWCQIFADILNRPVRQVRDPIQANVRGAAFIAAVGLGLISYDDVPDRTEYQSEYQPKAAHRDIYDTCFREFVNIYRQNKAIYRRLNARCAQSD
jgi:xylulokinase